MAKKMGLEYKLGMMEPVILDHLEMTRRVD